MSARKYEPESIPDDVLKPPLHQALRLGLRPYAEFVDKMSPLFRRVPADKSERFLREIYRLAAQKVLMDNGRTDVASLAQYLAKDAAIVQNSTSHIEAASQSLSAAAEALPLEFAARSEVENIISHLSAIERELKDRQQELSRFASTLEDLKGKEISVRTDSDSSLLYSVQLRKMNEVAPDLPSGEELLDEYIKNLGGAGTTDPYRYHLSSGRELTAADHWLIHAIDQSLPKAKPPRRSRFNRDQVTRMTFEAALGETLRSLEGFKSARRRQRKS